MQVLFVSEVSNPEEAMCQAAGPISGKHEKDAAGAQNRQLRNICDSWIREAALTNLFQTELLILANPPVMFHFS